MENEIVIIMLQPSIKFNLSLISSQSFFLYYLDHKYNLLVVLSSQLDRIIPQGQTTVSQTHTDTVTGNSGEL